MSKKSLFGSLFGGSKKNLDDPSASSPPQDSLLARASSRTKVTAKLRKPPDSPEAPKPTDSAETKKLSTAPVPGLTFPDAPQTFVPRQVGTSPLNRDPMRSASPTVSNRTPPRQSPSPTRRPQDQQASALNRISQLDSLRPASLELRGSKDPVVKKDSTPLRTPNQSSAAAAVVADANRERALSLSTPNAPATTSDTPAPSFRSSLMQAIMADANARNETVLQEIANYTPPPKPVPSILESLEIVVGDVASDVSSLSNGSTDYPAVKKRPSIGTGSHVEISSAEPDVDNNNRDVARRDSRKPSLNNLGTHLRRTGSGSADMMTQASPGVLPDAAVTPTPQPSSFEPKSALQGESEVKENFTVRGKSEMINACGPPPATERKSPTAPAGHPLLKKQNPLDASSSFLDSINKLMQQSDISPLDGLSKAAPEPVLNRKEQPGPASSKTPDESTAIDPQVTIVVTSELIKKEDHRKIACGTVESDPPIQEAVDVLNESKVHDLPIPPTPAPKRPSSCKVAPSMLNTLDLSTTATVKSPGTPKRSVRHPSIQTNDSFDYNVSVDSNPVLEYDEDESVNMPIGNEDVTPLKINRSGIDDESIDEVWPWLKDAIVNTGEDAPRSVPEAPNLGESNVVQSLMTSLSLKADVQPRDHDITGADVIVPAEPNVSHDFAPLIDIEIGHESSDHSPVLDIVAVEEPNLVLENKAEEPVSVAQIEGAIGLASDVDRPPSSDKISTIEVAVSNAPSKDNDANRDALVGNTSPTADETRTPPRNRDLDLKDLNSATHQSDFLSTPTRQVNAISEIMTRNNKIFENLLSLIDKREAGEAIEEIRPQSESSPIAAITEAIADMSPSRRRAEPAKERESQQVTANQNIPFYEEVKSSYNKSLKPSLAELNVAYRNAMSGISGTGAEHDRIMTSISKLSAVLEDKAPGEELNALLAPNWSLQLHLRHSLQSENLDEPSSLIHADRIAEVARSFISVADGRSLDRWNSDRDCNYDGETRVDSGIIVPGSLEEEKDSLPPAASSLVNSLTDINSSNRLVFSSSHDPFNPLNGVGNTLHLKYMNEHGEAKLNDRILQAQEALKSSARLLQSAVPIPGADGKEAAVMDIASQYDEGYPVMDIPMHPDELKRAEDLVISTFNTSDPNSVEALSDVITRAVMAAARAVVPAVNEEDVVYVDDDDTEHNYWSVKDREMRFDGRNYKLNNLVKIRNIESDTVADKSRTMFEMCDSDIDRLFNLGRDVVENGMHETYVNTLLENSHKFVVPRKENLSESRSLRYKAIPKSTRDIDAEINLSPFLSVSVGVQAQSQSGTYTLPTTSVSLQSRSVEARYRGQRRDDRQPSHKTPSPWTAGGKARKTDSASRPSSIRTGRSEQSPRISVRKLPSSGYNRNSWLEEEEPRRWHKPVEYTRAGSPGRLESPRRSRDELLSPMRKSRSRSPSPGYMSPYYYAGHVLSSSNMR